MIFERKILFINNKYINIRKYILQCKRFGLCVNMLLNVNVSKYNCKYLNKKKKTINVTKQKYKCEGNCE